MADSDSASPHLPDLILTETTIVDRSGRRRNVDIHSRDGTIELQYLNSIGEI